MNKPIGLLFRHILFFFLLFFIARVLFLVLNVSDIQSASNFEILKTFFYSIYLDIAALCYFIILLFIPYIFYFYTAKNIYFKIIKYISSFIVVLYFLVVLSEIMIYKEWKTKLSFRALSFLSNISEVMHVVALSQIIIGFAALASLSLFFIFIQNKFFLKQKNTIDPHKFWFATLYTILIGCFMPIGIRGGLQPIPIIQSDVYFSNNNALNLAAVNPLWNIGQSIWENRYSGSHNPYLYYSEVERNKLFNELTIPEKDSTIFILKNKKPNIILVMLESWSADFVGALEGKDSAAPQLSAIARAGIRFSNCYSPGTLSDEGNVSILSAFPAQPLTVLTRQPQKYRGLKTLTQSLMENGYSTSYVYNGDLTYGNIKSYVVFNNFQHISDKNNVTNRNWKSGRMGYHDEYLFERLKSEIQQLKPPFFLNAFTLSTHSPFDFESKKQIHGKGEYSDFMSSVYYSDSVIGGFIKYCKTQPWYQNTLFVFLSDHSHPTPSNNRGKFPDDRRMVAILYGDVIKDEFQGQKITSVINQHDFAPSICKQLSIKNPFKYGKDIFNPFARKFAYYSYDVGFGFVTDSGSYVYDLRDKKEILSTFNSKGGTLRADSFGKAYLQVLYTDYLSF
jgi:phosphoglycerol transferase MdoB-like AlkP superfamily enzyme